MGKSIDLLGGLRSIMEGERELLLYFGRVEVRKKWQSTVGEEGEGYKYPLAPNGHLTHDSAAAEVWQCLSSSATVPHYAR